VPKLLFFWLALCWSGMVIFFCLVQSSAIPVIQISNLDKIVHAFFHFVFSSLWFLFFEKQLKSSNVWKPLMVSFLLSFSFGIGIEIAQGLFTTSRKGDLLDILANTSGAFLAGCMIFLYKKYSSLNKN
jgi:VanZ family protein